MNSLTSLLRCTAALVVLCPALALAKAGWTDDYKKALEKAKTEKKMVLLDFTGSDWCGWCIKLDDEVFSKPKFKQYAKENLVLVELDFPQQRQLPKAKKEQNEELAKQYQVKGYPTVVILDSEGKKVGQLGYMPGGPEAFVAALEKIKSGAASPTPSQ
ncbi:MAG: thioredoxin family protein [Verrucomicrobiota bacterium]|nr:thioredoxin family protein [Verrucomicrobiota bacterium]